MVRWMSSACLLACLSTVAPGAPAAPLDEPIKPLPATLNQDPARAAIGARLFQDKRLSVNGTRSCASCHDLASGGSDRTSHSQGYSGKTTRVNAPTVLNAALNFMQFWNGRAATLEAQIEAVVEDPIEMGSRWPEVVAMAARDEAYRAAFGSAYRDGVTKANILDALASFERTLLTPDSRFDRYLRGEADALTEAERQGYAKFKRYGCIACHQGVNVGGNMFQKFGVMGDYFANRGHLAEADLGRFLVTGDEEDRHVFKVPGLRNVARTAPYFHDGSAATLEQAVDVMFLYQLGRTAPAQDKSDIVAFLRTLDGSPPGGAR